MVEIRQARSCEQLLGLRKDECVRTRPCRLVRWSTGQLGRVDPAMYVSPSVLRQRPFEDPPRGVGKERAQGAAELTAAPGPRHRPVVPTSRHSSRDRPESVPALLGHSFELRRRCLRRTGSRHSRTVFGQVLSAARIRSRSFASAVSRMCSRGRLTSARALPRVARPDRKRAARSASAPWSRFQPRPRWVYSWPSR